MVRGSSGHNPARCHCVESLPSWTTCRGLVRYGPVSVALPVLENHTLLSATHCLVPTLLQLAPESGGPSYRYPWWGHIYDHGASGTTLGRPQMPCQVVTGSGLHRSRGKWAHLYAFPPGRLLCRVQECGGHRVRWRVHWLCVVRGKLLMPSDLF